MSGSEVSLNLSLNPSLSLRAREPESQRAREAADPPVVAKPIWLAALAEPDETSHCYKQGPQALPTSRIQML